jgi:indolepyruvate ferredoxin oxidoreductase beta subunit
MMAAPKNDRPITIAVLALGGQGGGVLTHWLVDVAEANGFLAQSTYVAGVAQRTGATVYCIELYAKENADKHGKRPVFTPYPVPGDVDLVIAGEMAETGRAIQKGFVTPNATTLIASSHRIYSIIEKQAVDDGILDQSPVAEIAGKIAKKFICFDMAAAAEETNSVISAVMLGAIAATDVLPFGRDAYHNAIRDSGRSVEQNLAGFDAGYSGASSPAAASGQATVVDAQPRGENGRRLQQRIAVELPESVRAVALHGALRALDYQDARYASAYVDSLVQFCSTERSSAGDAHDFALTAEVARQLALQMCYEDTLRVADLKIRSDRSRRVRDQLGVSDQQPVHVVEYFHPRIEEFCDTLPAGTGRYILRSPRIRKTLAPLFSKGRNIKTTSITGFLMLRLVAGMTRWRRSTYRFAVQQDLVAGWLENVHIALQSNYDSALRVAGSIESVRGYGDTYERGLKRYKDALQ